MDWTFWLLLAASLAGLYALGLVGYRLFLSGKGLKQQIDQARSLVDQAKAFDELEVTSASPSSAQDLSKLLVRRRAFVRQRRKKAEERQHRLVERIRDIEIDKRKA